MKPRKLKSGSWNVSVYVGKDENGKKHYRSVTAKTRKECLTKAQGITVKHGEYMRVTDAVTEFLTAKRNVLSPNTYRAYLAIYNNHIKESVIGAVPISLLTDSIVQKWVSRLALEAAPKTVKNIYGLFSAALRFEDNRITFNVKLPQSKMQKLHTPTTAEVKAVLELAKPNPPLYRAILLGAVGMMRLCELCALTA